MELTFSSRDCALLQRALEVITAPLDAPSMSQWRLDVLASLAPIFEADFGAFVFAGNDEPPCSLLELPQRYVEDYLAFQVHDSANHHFDTIEQGACTEMLGGRAALTASGIYNDFYRHYDVEEGTFVSFGVADRAPMIGPDRSFLPGGRTVNGMLSLYADGPGREGMGAARARVLSMLKPAIRAGAQAWLALGERRQEMLALIDTSADATIVFAADGTTIHRSAAVQAMAGRDTAFAEVEMGARALARTLETWFRAGDAASGLPATTVVLRTIEQRYSVRATRSAILGGRDPVLIVAIAPLSLALPSLAQVQRLGLTSREAEVARLIARGRTNKEISAALGVTEHTARRHTERVFQKLGVRSRSCVAGRLLEIGVD